MSLVRPVPTLDHVVVNARDRLDDAQAAYTKLGFTLTPRGHHSLGSANHLAIFGTDYLELIGVPSPDAARQEIMQEPHGLNGLVFGTEDSAACYAALAAAGVPATPPNEFSRPVTIGGVARDAVFRTIHIQPEAGRPGRLYFCHHFTRDLVWRDAWRHHANGTIGVVRAVIASADPALLGALFARMFGAETVRAVDGGFSLALGLQRFDVLSHAVVAGLLGKAAGDPAGRAHYMAALTLRTLSLEQAEAALAGVAAMRETARILVPADAAMGCPIEFVA